MGYQSENAKDWLFVEETGDIEEVVDFVEGLKVVCVE